MVANLNSLRTLNPQLYDEFIKDYSSTSLDAIIANDDEFSKLTSRFQEYMSQKNAEKIVQQAVEAEVSTGVAETPEINNTNIDANADKAADPYYWEGFYRPATQEDIARAEEITKKLEGEWKENKTNSSYLANNITVSPSLNPVLELVATRRLAMSAQDITFENFNNSRAVEKQRMQVEYYTSLYALSIGKEKYASLKAVEMLNRISVIDAAIKEGKTAEEIYKILDIKPSEDQKKVAAEITSRSNIEPVRVWANGAKKFLHKAGRFMDKMQKLESEHSGLAIGVNMQLAGNPIYMAYKSVMASRAIYNDFKGFQEYAAFRSLYVKDSTKKFRRSDYDKLKQSASVSYESYVASFSQKDKDKNKVMSKDIFEQATQFSTVNSRENYEEYLRDAKTNKLSKVLSEEEYNKVHVMTKNVKSVPIYKGFTNLDTLKQVGAHSIIFFSSLPLIGQSYAAFKTADNICKKSYWQTLGSKVTSSGKSIKKLWQAKGQDKEAWKELYSSSSRLISEVAGAVILVNGASRYDLNFVGSASAADVVSNVPFALQNNPNPMQNSWQSSYQWASPIVANDISPEISPENFLQQEATVAVPPQVEVALDVNSLSDRQQHDVDMLMKTYPRAAALILEGNINPDINDAPTEKFFTSSQLRAMWDSGQITDAQKAQMVEYANTQFDEHGNKIGADAVAREAEGKAYDEMIKQRQAHAPAETKIEQAHAPAETKTEQTAAASDAPKQAEKETIVEQPAQDVESKLAYRFDKYGNVIHSFDSIHGMSQEQLNSLDSKIYDELRIAQANGENLDAGALRFMATQESSQATAQQPLESRNTDSEKPEETTLGKSEKIVLEEEGQKEEEQKPAPKAKRNNHGYVDDLYATADDPQIDHRIKTPFFRGTYSIADTDDGNVFVDYKTRFPVFEDREVVEILRVSQEGNMAGNGHIKSDSFSNTRLEIDRVAKSVTIAQVVYDDLSAKAANGAAMTENEQQFLQKYPEDLVKLGLERTEDGHWQKAPSVREAVSDELEPIEEKTTEVVREEIAQQEPEIRKVKGDGFSGEYSITEDENGRLSYMSSGSVRVDQDVYGELRDIKQVGDKYVAANGTISNTNYSVVSSKVMLVAQEITKNEVVYDDLQSRENRSPAEEKFMKMHEYRLEKLGLTHDTNGDVVKAEQAASKPYIKPAGKSR